MIARICVPTFPFPAEEICWAVDLRNTVLGLADVYGNNHEDWSDVLSAPDFQESLASHWVFLFGREPSDGMSIATLLHDVLSVTEEAFVARTQTGAVPS